MFLRLLRLPWGVSSIVDLSTHAIYVLSDAFARLKSTKGWEHSLERSFWVLGLAMLNSGQAAEAEAHFHECFEKPGQKGRPFMPITSATALRAEALVLLGRNKEALALVMNLEEWSSYAGDWATYYQDLQEQFKVYKRNDDTEAGELEFIPYLTSMLRDTNTTAAQAAQYLQTAMACKDHGDLEEAETHLWKAVDAYKLAKEKSTISITSDKFLPCLELLAEILEQQGGPGRSAKALELRKEIEESQARVETMYAAAMEETRRDNREKRGEKARKKKKGSKNRRGKAVKKDSCTKGAEIGGRRRAVDNGGKEKEEGTQLSLEGLIVKEEGEIKEKEKEGEKDEEEEEEVEVCAICLGSMDEEEGDENDVVCRLLCSHEFHGGCMEGWTSTGTRKGLLLTCPTCRRPLVHG